MAAWKASEGAGRGSEAAGRALEAAESAPGGGMIKKIKKKKREKTFA